jgi:hypothetical protein
VYRGAALYGWFCYHSGTWEEKVDVSGGGSISKSRIKRGRFGFANAGKEASHLRRETCEVDE